MKLDSFERNENHNSFISESIFKLAFFIILMITTLTLVGCSNDNSEIDGDTETDSDIKTDGDADSSENEEEQIEDPNIVFMGGFKISVDPDNATLNITGKDNRKLLEGLGAKPISVEGYPTTGFAARDIIMSYEMMYGAFKPTDEILSDWVEAKSLVMEKQNDHVTISTLSADDKVVSKLTISSPSNGHLKILAAEGELGKQFSLGYVCDEEDHFIGFGAQTADVDHRGYTVDCWVMEQGIGKVEDDNYDGVDWMMEGRRHSSHLPIPQYISRRGYVMTVETDLRATFALCSENEESARVEFQTPSAIHIFDGPSPKEALERSSAVFGRPNIPPRFAFAPWLDAIYGSDNVRRVAKMARDKGIPASAIWSEDWKGATQNGDNYVLSEDWTLDRAVYPDFETLADDLHMDGYKFLVYFNTFAYEDAEEYQDMVDKKVLIEDENGEPYIFHGHKFANSSLLDLSKPHAKQWAKDKLMQAISLGADGWMGDFAEWMPPDAFTAKGTGMTQHNLHPVQWQKVQREALDEAMASDGVDRLMFGRSGWLGTPALADVIWAADQNTNFKPDDGLPTVLPIGIGLGAVGISTFGHDIAGYQSFGMDPADKELYFRWTELGAFSPVMRTHHGYQAKLNWNMESDEESTQHFKRYAKLHIALAPYIMGLAKVAHETGVSIWRGMGVIFPEDANVWPIKDQVMMGDHLLIAPVLERSEVALSEVCRDIYFPSGQWFRVFDYEESENEIDSKIAGSSVTKKFCIGMTEIAVFAQSGAIIPMYPDGVMTLVDNECDPETHKSVGDNRIVKIFLGKSSEFVELDELTYTITHIEQTDSTINSISFNEAELLECDDENSFDCIDSSEEGLLKIRITGNGELSLLENDDARATFSLSGGDNNRETIVHVRY